MLRDAGLPAIFSYAGRTNKPVAQPLPTRIGGFGGVDGLVRFLETEAITHVIDATHPFAALMSRNALSACAALGLPLVTLERPPWEPRSGDRWSIVANDRAAVAAVQALPPSRVFLAIGKQRVDAFTTLEQHQFLLRLVDPPVGELPRNTTAVLGRGPFTPAEDAALFQQHRITLVVSKNSGGTGADAKLVAARRLGVPVMMIARPSLPERHVFETAEAVLRHLQADLGV